MRTLRSWGAAARRSPLFWALTALVVAALVAGAVVVATRPGPTGPPPPAPATSTRVVALGDSVPYGHGLANPYRTPRPGLPPHAVSQGPSVLAYPTRVTRDLGLVMTVRRTNCELTGDQLAISGAVADPVDNTERDGQCPFHSQSARNLENELAVADLVHHPARLVLLQDGADDINFAACLEHALAQVHGLSLGIGTVCTHNGRVTPQLATNLAHVRTSLAGAIEQVAPRAHRVAVLNYYQPIPEPSQIADDTGVSGFRTNLVCAGLKPNAVAAYAAARVVLGALNGAIAGAVADARAHHVRNVTLVDVSRVADGHAMCTADPWVFSGELVSDATLAKDAERLVAAKACTGTTIVHGAAACNSLTAAARAAKQDLRYSVWRAAHPTAAGQRALAAKVVATLRGQT